MMLVADLLALTGCLGLTLAVVGLIRFPDTASRVHAASKASYFGVCPLLLASALVLGGHGAARAALVAACLLFAPVLSGHAIGRAAWRGDVGAPE